MWVWTKWATWVKILITIPIVFAMIGIFAVALLAAVNPKGALEKADCTRQCETFLNKNVCFETCLQEKS